MWTNHDVTQNATFQDAPHIFTPGVNFSLKVSNPPVFLRVLQHDLTCAKWTVTGKYTRVAPSAKSHHQWCIFPPSRFTFMFVDNDKDICWWWDFADDASSTSTNLIVIIDPASHPRYVWDRLAKLYLTTVSVCTYICICICIWHI